MVQILPAVSSFGDHLREALSKGISGASKHLQQRQAQTALEKLLASQQGGANTGNQAQTGQSGAPIKPFEVSRAIDLAIQSGMDPAAATALGSAYMKNQELDSKEAATIRAEQRKIQQESKEKQEKSDIVISSVEDMRKLLPYTGSTKVPFTSSFNASPGGLNREGLEKRNEFDTLAASAASFFRDLETKGQLPQGLYEQVIKPRLPSAELSERENKGRLNGIEALAKKYGGISSKKAPEETRLQKVQKGTKITEDVAKQILSQANGDKAKARELAKGLGYEF